MAENTARSGVIRRIAIGTLSNYVGHIVALGVGLALTPFMVRHLGITDYGLWILISVVVAYGGLLDFGITTALIKYIAEYRTKPIDLHARQLVSTAVFLYCMLGLLAIMLAYGVSLILPYVVALPYERQCTAQVLLLISGLSLGISLPCLTITAMLRGLQRYELTNILGIVGTLLSAGVTVAVLTNGGGIIELAVANFLCSLAMQVPNIIILRTVAPQLHIHWTYIRRELIGRITAFSWSLFVVNVASQLQSKTDELVIGANLGLAHVTAYNIGRRLSDLSATFTSQFIKVLLPVASELHASADERGLQTFYLVSTRLTMMIFMPIAICLIALSQSILMLWMGADYMVVAPIVIVLTIAMGFEMLMWPAATILQGIARHQQLATIAICSGLSNLILSVVLVRSIGTLGVAIGTLIPVVIECVGFILPFTLHVMNIPWRRFLRESILPTLGSAMPVGLLLATYQFFVPVTSLPMLGLVGLSASVLYGLLYARVGAGEVELRALQQVRQRLATVFAA